MHIPQNTCALFFLEAKIPSKWSLVDVYMETSYVLSGLSMKCDLKLISPDSIDMRTKSSLNTRINQIEYEPCTIHQVPSNGEISSASICQMNDNFEESSDIADEQNIINDGDCSQEKDMSCNTVETTIPSVISIDKSAQKRRLEDSNLDEEPNWKVKMMDVSLKDSTTDDCSSMESEMHREYSDIGEQKSLDINSCKEDRLPEEFDAEFNQSYVFSESGKIKQTSDDFRFERCNLDISLTNSSCHAFQCHSDPDSHETRLTDIKSHEEIPSTCRKYQATSVAENCNKSSINRSSTIHSKDLPLMANVDDVLVKHYILDLDVDFKTKIISGTIILFLEPARHDANECNFQMCLDSTMVTVESAVEIPVPDDLEIHFHDKKCCCATFDDLERHKQSKFNEISNDTIEVPCSTNSDAASQCHGGLEKGILSSSSTFDHYNYKFVKVGDENNRIAGQKSTKCHRDGCVDHSITERVESQTLSDGGSIETKETKCNCSSSDAEDGVGNRLLYKCRHCQFLNDLKAVNRNANPLKFKKLAYSIHGWCIRVWKEGEDAKVWPRCVKIWYHTSPDGQSIMWAKDQEGK